jgi:hypothetical protein
MSDIADRFEGLTRYRLRPKTLALWTAIIETLHRQRPPMTVRGLFYALEILGLVPKSESGYRQVAYQVLRMRRLGILPYHCIADGTRWVCKPRTYTGLRACLETTKRAYRRALWDDQPAYVEIWVEKDAIAGVLYDTTDTWDVPLYVCRGFPSETFLFDAAETIRSQQSIGKSTFIYYIGDLDPSGWAISQTIERRLREFGAEFTFQRLAVTPDQVEEWQLPTRPPRPKDSRAKNWRWPCVEVDAVPASLLRSLCEKAITSHINADIYYRTLEIEKAEREALEAFMSKLGELLLRQPDCLGGGP